MIERREGHPIKHLSRVSEIPFDDSCVVIADGDLPSSVLHALPEPILVHSGERLKTLAAIEVLAELVLQRRSSKPLTLVAVGGGSVGDTAGFLASILWRGVTLWHVPTTLLAMVDSSHGGKTAVNLGSAKNQLGTFYPAVNTFLVQEFLETLPRHIRREGLSELLKALWLGDAEMSARLTPALVSRLSVEPFGLMRNELLEFLDHAIEVKLDIIADDPRETKGIRTVLNLGHTVGHALELVTGITHGEAIAWGLASALHLSKSMSLPEDVFRQLFAQLYPLLRPLPFMPSDASLLSVMQRDKKHHRGVLRSVVLQAIGRPMVTELISAQEWIDAFKHMVEWFERTPVTATLVDAKRHTLHVEPGKSEINRSLIIAALRTGKTEIRGRSSADDVRYMVMALQALGYPVMETRDSYLVDHSKRETFETGEREVFCGDGGTTFRFLLALCSMNRNSTKLYASDALLARPHEALIRSLKSAGASIEEFRDEKGRGLHVRGWENFPGTLSVECGDSSQYASAIALLSAGSDAPFNLRLLGDCVSAGYFEMTLKMLEQTGVEMIRSKDLIAFNPTSRLNEPLVLNIPPDASGEAVWKVAKFFEHPLQLPVRTETSHPDTAIDAMLDAIYSGQQLDEIVLDCTDCPDLAPLLAVAAFRSSKPVRIAGVAHLRHKETNRIEALVRSLNDVGIAAVAMSDGIRIPARAAMNLNDAQFDSHGDHRLVMTGLLLTMISGNMTITHPWSVTKSYPSFWDDARFAGWEMEPLVLP